MHPSPFHQDDAGDGHPDTFVITGDIPAMWLRDSTWQTLPHLPLAREDPHLARLFLGLVRRMAAQVCD